MPAPSLTPEEHRRAWRQMLITAGTAAVVILVLKQWGMPRLVRYLSSPDPALAAQHFTRFMEGFAAFLFLIAIYFLTYAWRILRSGQVPPPGAWGLRRAPRTGREARAAGVILALGAAGLLALAMFALRVPGRVLAARAAKQAGGSAR